MRARIKSFEDMPEQAKCCPETIKAMMPYCGTIINLVPGSLKDRPDRCPFCGAEYSDMSYLIDAGFNYNPQMYVEYMDIDEGTES